MRYLVLCTGNRCRSQMAHGILQHLHPEATVCSAGVRPANEVHPLAIKVMDEFRRVRDEILAAMSEI